MICFRKSLRKQRGRLQIISQKGEVTYAVVGQNSKQSRSYQILNQSKMFAPSNQGSSSGVSTGITNRTTARSKAGSSQATNSNIVNNFHGYSRSQLPSQNISNLQQVRKTVYTNVGPTALSSTQNQRKRQTVTSSQHHNNPTTSVIQQHQSSSHQQQQESTTVLSTPVNLHISTGGSIGNKNISASFENNKNLYSRPGTNNVASAVAGQTVISRKNRDENTTSLLTVATSQISQRHNAAIAAVSGLTSSLTCQLAQAAAGVAAGSKQGDQQQQTEDSTNLTNAMIMPGSTVASPTNTLQFHHNSLPHHQNNSHSAGNIISNSSSNCVTQDMLLSTVKALVDHFESKINDLAANSKSKNKASFSNNNFSSSGAANEILDRIQQILKGTSKSTQLQQQQQQLLLQEQKQQQFTQFTQATSDMNRDEQINTFADATQNFVNNEQHQCDSITAAKQFKLEGNQKNNGADKENQPAELLQPKTAQKIQGLNIEDFEQLTMAQVPRNELLGSTASAKTGNVSSRSLIKSSRSRKKHEKKSESHFSKMPATQPFKTSTNISQNTNTYKNSTSNGNRKKSTLKRGSASTTNSNSRGVSSTQNLFKPNPNFASNKQAKQQKQQPLTANHYQTMNPKVSSSRNDNPSQQNKRVPSHDALKEQYSGISGDNDSGLLANLSSYRNQNNNHFQDIVSNSSFLKSIGQDLQETGKLTAKANDEQASASLVKTPGLGEEQQIITTERSGRFRNSSDSIRQAPSNFNLDNQLQEDEVLSAEQERKTPFDQSQEIDKKTPDKGQDYILQLLSSLEGLTPAGLEHLMETQDKLASTTTTTLAKRQKNNDAFADLELNQKKTSEIVVQPHFGSGLSQTRASYFAHSQQIQKSQQHASRSSNGGSCTARQTLKFVDTSDQQSIPSPTPNIAYSQYNTTLDPQSRPGEMITARGPVQKRLMYESLSNESGKLAGGRQAITARGSTKNLHQVSNPPAANTAKPSSSRRLKSTRSSGTTTGGAQKSLNKTAGSLALKQQSVLEQRRNTASTRNQKTTSSFASQTQQQQRAAITPRINNNQSHGRGSLNQSLNATAKQPSSVFQQQRQSVEVLTQIQKSTTSQRATRPSAISKENLKALDKEQQSSQATISTPVLKEANKNNNQNLVSQSVQVLPKVNMDLNNHFKINTKKTLITGVEFQQQTQNQQHQQLQKTTNDSTQQMRKSFQTQSNKFQKPQAEQQQQQQQQSQTQSRNSRNQSTKSLTRANSSTAVGVGTNGGYEERFKQLTQLVEKHNRQPITQQSSVESTELNIGAPDRLKSSVQRHHQQSIQHQRLQQSKAKSTESTIVEKETHFKIGIESEPVSSDELYDEKQLSNNEEDDDDHIQDINDGLQRSCSSEKLAHKQIDADQDEVLLNGDIEDSLFRRNPCNDDDEDTAELVDQEEELKCSEAMKEELESIGSLERQIQQIVLSRDLLQNMEVNLHNLNMKNAGSVLEPEDQTRCMMINQANTHAYSSIGMNTAQELEPSLPQNQLNLSGEDSPQAQGAGHFDQNTSNISFG